MTTIILIGQELIWVKHLIGGLLMFIFAFLDHRYYKFYPLEAGIFIDMSGRDKRDLVYFNQINTYVQTTGSSLSVYEVIYKD